MRFALTGVKIFFFVSSLIMVSKDFPFSVNSFFWDIFF